MTGTHRTSMKKTSRDDLAALLCQRVEVLAGFEAEEVRATVAEDGPAGPVSCLVELDGRPDTLVVRMPREPGAPSGRGAGSLRPAAEARTLALVTPLGLAPATLQYEVSDGLWVTPLWPGGVPVGTAMTRDPSAVERLARALRLLHVSGLRVEGTVDPFADLDRPPGAEYQERADGLPARSLETLRDVIGRCQEVLALDLPSPVPCVNIPAFERCLDTGSRAFFSDWQWSGMGDPHYDVAALIERGAFDGDHVSRFLRAYFRTDAPVETDRVQVYRLVVAYHRLLEAVEGCAAGTGRTAPDADQDQWRARLEDCQALLEHPAWTQAMERMTARSRPMM